VSRRFRGAFSRGNDSNEGCSFVSGRFRGASSRGNDSNDSCGTTEAGVWGRTGRKMWAGAGGGWPPQKGEGREPQQQAQGRLKYARRWTGKYIPAAQSWCCVLPAEKPQTGKKTFGETDQNAATFEISSSLRLPWDGRPPLFARLEASKANRPGANEAGWFGRVAPARPVEETQPLNQDIPQCTQGEGGGSREAAGTDRSSYGRREQTMGRKAWREGCRDNLACTRATSDSRGGKKKRTRHKTLRVSVSPSDLRKSFARSPTP